LGTCSELPLIRAHSTFYQNKQVEAVESKQKYIVWKAVVVGGDGASSNAGGGE
jgi:hypothetical protein